MIWAANPTDPLYPDARSHLLRPAETGVPAAEIEYNHNPNLDLVVVGGNANDQGDVARACDRVLAKAVRSFDCGDVHALRVSLRRRRQATTYGIRSRSSYRRQSTRGGDAPRGPDGGCPIPSVVR